MVHPYLAAIPPDTRQRAAPPGCAGRCRAPEDLIAQGGRSGPGAKIDGEGDGDATSTQPARNTTRPTTLDGDGAAAGVRVAGGRSAATVTVMARNHIHAGRRPVRSKER
jgi:hypothetical protein